MAKPQPVKARTLYVQRRTPDVRFAFAAGLMLGALAYPLGVIVGDVLAGRAALAPPSDTR